MKSFFGEKVLQHTLEEGRDTISSPCYFLKIWEALPMYNGPIFKISNAGVILTFIMPIQSLIYQTR